MAYTMHYYGYLAHSGRKGMKWGVRNGPPYPIEDNVLRKGTQLSNVNVYKDSTKQYINAKRPMYLYNQDDEWDRKVYEGAYSYYLSKVRWAGQGYTTDAVNSIKYEVVKDLKMPTSKERKDLFIEIINSNPEYGKELMKFRPYSPLTNKNGLKHKNDYKKIGKDEQITKDAYEVFNHMMESSQRYGLTKTYMTEIRSRYDAMVDDNNVNIYNRAHDPIIIFDVEKALREIGSKKIYINDIIKDTNDVAKELEKHGERLKL